VLDLVVRRLPAAVLLALSLLLAAPGSARAEGAISAYYPAGDGLAIVIWSGGPIDELVAALEARRCGPRSLWLLPAGADREALSYLPGAPEHVNRGWTERHGSDAPAGARVLAVCGAAPRATASVLEGAQVLSLYGYPGVPVMGVLGAMSPEAAADEALRRAAEYDALNGPRGVVAALQPIVSVAHRDPGAFGTYAAGMPRELLDRYVEVARRRGLLLFLDFQVGWGDPLFEVRALEDLLREPFVHVALDPEYMTRPDGLPPGEAIGTITGQEVDAVQAYLAGLVRTHRLPPKILVVHQFVDDMIVAPGGFADEPLVEVVIDMDGFGPPLAKLSKYDRYALGPDSERAAIKLFLLWDEPLLSPADVQSLASPPDLVIYQ
jgi:hypothetical protein